MNDYQRRLKSKMKEYAHYIYKISRQFPKEEMYGSVSQLRRSALSVPLNYIEGYARYKILVRINFLEISYGSLRESKFLLEFALEENWIIQTEYEFANNLSEEIGAMLWSEIKKLKNN
ncbi:four helix bundle protein [Patescibacteria group bacterium]